MNAPAFASKLQRVRKQLLEEIVNKQYADEEEGSKSRLSMRRMSVSTESPAKEKNDKTPAFQISVQSTDLTLKTMVNENNTVAEVCSKLRRKFPGETGNWAISLGTCTLTTSKMLT